MYILYIPVSNINVNTTLMTSEMTVSVDRPMATSVTAQLCDLPKSMSRLILFYL